MHVAPSMQHHAPSSPTVTEAPRSEAGAFARYSARLDTRDLIVEVRTLLTAQRRADRLICRYLADLADRVRERQDPELAAYVDEFHAARCFFQLGVRETRERVRVGRALRQLPEIEQAFIDGALSYSRVRELTRVATPASEGVWLSLAERLNMRSLERRVAAAAQDQAHDQAMDGAAAHPSGSIEGSTKVQWTTPHRVRVIFELSAEAWALLERAIDGARHLAVDTLSDGEALEAVARDALSRQLEHADASDPRSSVVMYTCKRCGTSDLDTGADVVELDPARRDTFACGAGRVDGEQEGRTVTFGGPLPSAVRRAVMLRDRCSCRVPGCRRRRYVDVHHITSQANGGAHSRGNCVVLCTTHHRLLHEGKLRITGDADGELDVRDSNGMAIGETTAQRAGASSPADSTQGGSSPADSTQGGSSPADSTQGGSSPADSTQGGSSPEERLLRIMGRRGGWSADELVESSGLSASTVSITLLMLELDGKVRNDDMIFARV